LADGFGEGLLGGLLGLVAALGPLPPAAGERIGVDVEVPGPGGPALVDRAAHQLADPHLPRSLSWQLEGAGFQVERREVLVLFNPEYDPDTYSVANGQIMADFAVAQGRMLREEAEAWMRDLQRLGSQGRYFFSLNRYLFLATRRP
jgi:hypothetical protein